VLGSRRSVVGLDPHPAHRVGHHRHGILLEPTLCDATRVSEHPNVELRDVVESDLPIFFDHEREPEANEMAAFPPRERDAFMQHWETKILANETGTAKTVVIDGHVAGNVLSWEQDGRRQIGYWIGKEFWGRGIATKAVRLFLDLVTQRPLYAQAARHNRASIRVLEKCGFTLDERSPEHPDEDAVTLKLEA
jgi:RimJ/RimL family protein N-acetyltransferase